MADVRKIVDHLIDVDRSERVVAEGDVNLAVDNVIPSYFYGSQILFRVKLYVGSQNVPFLPPTGATWTFGIDKDHAIDQSDLVLSEDSQFNIVGDWDEMSVAGGVICWRADMTTAAVKAYLNGAVSRVGYADLWMTPLGGKPTILAEWQVSIHGVAVDISTAVAVDGVSHVLSSMYEADRAQLLAPTDGLYRIKNGAIQLKNTTTGKFRTMYLVGPADAPQTAFGSEED